MDDNTKAIHHIEANLRGFDLVEISYCVESWWVKFHKGNIHSRPAVHKEFIHAYAIGLANFEEEVTKQSESVE